MIDKLYSIFLSSSGVATDTRKIKEGTIFFALKGDNFNGNKYASDAIKSGAIAAVIDEEEYMQDGMFLVQDVLKALQDLATYHREQFDIPVLALTGSNGKTTTKELIASVLKQKYKVHSTRGNFNNHIGVPLTLLEMPLETEIAIIEMGANHQGEIKQLAQIAKPNYGLITNIGKAHLEGFGGIEGVKKGKLELHDYIFKSNGSFFVNKDDEILNRSIQGMRIDYGIRNTIELQPQIIFKLDKYLVRSFLFGSYNFQNIEAAICIGNYFDVNLLDIIYGIESYVPDNNRSQYIKMSDNLIILDAYNANPSSMRLSIENFCQRRGDKIAVLGSMKELGVDTNLEHQSLVDFAASKNINQLIFFGEEFKDLMIPDGHYKCSSIAEIQKVLNLKDLSNFTILIKGSRANRLETII